MTQTIIPVDNFDLVVFGATGDLALRKLFQALYQRDAAGQIPRDARIIGVSLTEYDTDEFRSKVHESLELHIDSDDLDPGCIEHFISRIHYVPVDVTDHQTWAGLSSCLQQEPDRIRVYYLSVAPSFFGVIAQGLAATGLNQNGARLVVEKPFGHDQKSAEELNQQLGDAFPEGSIYRIDHYLGKETVQNLMAFRFANSLFEPQWNSHAVDHVQITVAETLGVGTRGRYYDGVGAMRDMVQNHLIQLLCLIAMEPPYAFTADALRDEKIKVLRSLRPLTGKDALENTRRGQYLSSKSEPGYVEEVNTPDSITETYVAIKAELQSWRWSGVPFYLRTGKKLRDQLAEIAITFKTPHYTLFGDIATPVRANTLVIRLQPDEGLSLSVMTKDPGPGGFRLHESVLDMSFSETRTNNGIRAPDSYERLLMDVVRGDQTLFMRRDEVEVAWKWIDPIISAWQASGERPESYDSGSSGPAGSIELMAGNGRRWRDIKS
jgi:glucose-6-phosphate 1-dehydrogenase